MTQSLTSLENAFREAVLAAGTNSEVIFHFPNAPRPAFPYTSIQYLSVSEEIDDWNEYDNDDDLLRYFGYRNLVFTLNCFGDNAKQEASNLQGSLRKVSVRTALRETISAAITSVSAVQDLTELIDDEYEQRASIDVTLNVNMEDGSTTDDPGYYNKVDVEWQNRPPEN